MNAITISVKELTGQHLNGRVAGQRDFARLCEELAGTAPGSVILLDFDGVSLVSGSWANAALVSLYRWSAESQIDLYPILVNANDESLEDIQLVAKWNHQTYLHGVGNGGPPKRATIVGLLDQAQRRTLNTVLELGEVTGAQLAGKTDEPIKATAWNNRLKDLHSKRLLQRKKRGREQIYFPVVTEIELNGR